MEASGFIVGRKAIRLEETAKLRFGMVYAGKNFRKKQAEIRKLSDFGGDA